MLSASADTIQELSRSEWLARIEAHRSRVSAWTRARVARRFVAEKDPVFDFMFDYYSFRPGHLERWSPGLGVFLHGITVDEMPWAEAFSWERGGAILSASSFPAQRRAYVTWATRYLARTAERTPTFHCFGLHEWAMLYKAEGPRHEQVPLRLTSAEVDRVVEEGDLRCTHFDAYRFFTAPALPRNRFTLARDVTADFDQRGCLHVNMDLYKFAYKVAPWCSSDVLADAFLVAIEARKLDMRASPYDLREYGFEPICIETPEGREVYVREQRRVAELAMPVRAAIFGVYSALCGGASADC
jgi:hypothetical protein